MAGILGIEYALPDKTLSNDELASTFQTWTAGKIYDKTGIESRHIASENETAGDLGAIAAERLLDSGLVERSVVDFLILVTETPDYLIPPTACVMQERLGLKKSCGAFDINLGCSGFVYGLAVAKGLVDTGIARNVLLVTADTYSKHINELDKSTRTIFGDAAAATLVGVGGMQIGEFDLGTDGGGEGLLRIPAGGARRPRDAWTSIEQEVEGNVRSAENLYMDGTGVFEFTIREVPESVRRLLELEDLNKKDVDLFVFHQANRYMLDFLRRVMRLDEERCYVNMADTGNTVSASIPIALKRAIEDGSLRSGMTVVLCGFGVGLSWGATTIRTGVKQ